MRMRLILAGAALALVAMGVSGCDPVRHALHINAGRRMSVPATLDCPERQGDLTRIAAAADGRSCDYKGGMGQAVTLSILPLNGQSPRDALAPLEAQLRGLTPPDKSAPPAGAKGAGRGGDESESNDDAAQDRADAAREAAQDRADAARDAAQDRADAARDAADAERDRAQAERDHAQATRDGSHTRVDLPFVHIDADDSTDHAKVDAPFLHVDADDQRAHVKVLGVTIDADNDNANVHTDWGSKTAMIKASPKGAEIRAVDLRRGAVDMLYVLAGDHPGPSGYRSVGYVARGPASGPLVVGVFKSAADQHHDYHDHDVDALIRRNLKPQ